MKFPSIVRAGDYVYSREPIRVNAKGRLVDEVNKDE
jgi:hypothetical protein